MEKEKFYVELSEQKSLTMEEKVGAACDIMRLLNGYSHKQANDILDEVKDIMLRYVPIRLESVPLSEGTLEVGYKIRSSSEGVGRLKALTKKIDELISYEESLLPDKCYIDVITDHTSLKAHVNPEGRFVKFCLFVHEGSLPD